MEHFNCKKLNEVFNIDGLDSILVESVNELNSNIIGPPTNNQRNKIIDFVDKRLEILKIKTKSEEIVYQKERNNYVKSIDDWINETIKDLLHQQRKYLVESEELSLSEYKKVRKRFIAFIEQLDVELGERLYQKKRTKPKPINTVNLIKREQKIKDALQQQKNFLNKQKLDYTKLKT
jgi:hypothetical protein